MATRIYVVQMKGAKPRLVDATTGAQAIRHVAKGIISAKVATAKQTAEMMKSGATLETAGGEDEQAAEAAE